RQAGEITVEPRRVRTHNPLPLGPEADGGPVAAARRVAEKFLHGARVDNWNAPTPPSVHARVNLASQVGAVAWVGRSVTSARAPYTSRWFYMMRGRANGIGHSGSGL